MDLALNNLQRLICHKTKPSNHHLRLISAWLITRLLSFHLVHLRIDWLLDYSVSSWSIWVLGNWPITWLLNSLWSIWALGNWLITWLLSTLVHSYLKLKLYCFFGLLNLLFLQKQWFHMQVVCKHWTWFHQVVWKIMSNFRINFYSWTNQFKLCFNQSKYDCWTSMHFYHRLSRLFMPVQ